MVSHVRARSGTKVPSDDVKVVFGSQVRKELEHLHRLLEGRDGIDSDVQELVKSMMNGKPQGIQLTLTCIGIVFRDVASLAEREGDERLRQSLQDLTGYIMDDQKRSPGVSVTVEAQSLAR